MAANQANASAPAVPPVRRVRQATMLAYGFGAVAYGVKGLCFSTFLLLFYNQVLGLPSAQVGFAIMCALLLDAFIDPAIGFLSDRTGGRWGRRHPWMYASAAPTALGWLLLWNPPAWSQPAMLVWVFATAVLVPTAVSAYVVPSVDHRDLASGRCRSLGDREAEESRTDDEEIHTVHCPSGALSPRTA